MEYQIQMVYEESDVSALVQTLEYRRNPDPGKRQARKVIYPILGALLILTGLSVIVAGLFTIATIAACIICLIVGITLIRRSSTRGMERRSWKKYPNKGMTITYTFYADHFEEEDEATGKHEFRYLSVKNGNQDDGHFFLFTNDNTAHMLRKDGFVQGDPETFPNFIRKKAAVLLDSIE